MNFIKDVIKFTIAIIIATILANSLLVLNFKQFVVLLKDKFVETMENRKSIS